MLAIPALLFRTVALMKPQDATPFGLWLAFFGGLALTWILTTLISQKFDSLSASGGAAAAMAAGFGNVALLGTPLALAHLARSAAVPLGLILSIHAPILWFAATLQRELARHSSAISYQRAWPRTFLEPRRQRHRPGACSPRPFGGSPALAFTPSSTACSPCSPMPASPPPFLPLACRLPPIPCAASGAAWPC